MRFIKKTASVVASLIIILALGGFVFVRNFDLNRYKSYIEETVARETGRRLIIRGDAQLGISFVPTVVVNDVEFSNPEWAKNPQMVKLQRLEVKFAILPLLKKQIEVDKLILLKPEIYLETTAAGQNNWEFAGKVVTANQDAKSPAAKQPQVKNAAQAAAVGLIARDVLLQNGVVSYFDGKSGKTTQAVINEFEMEIPGDEEPLTLSVDAVLDGQKIVAEVEANNLNSLINEGKADFTAEVTAMKVRAKLAGAVEDIKESPRYAIEGNIHNPAGNFGAPETSLELRADGDVNSADITIKSLNIATNLVKGTAAVNWSKKKPEIKADLTSTTFNVNRLNKNSAVAWAIPAFVSEAQALEMIPNDKIPYQSLNLVNAILNVKVGKLILADDFTLNNVDLAAKLQNGVLNVNELKANVGGGQLDAKMMVNAAQQSVTFNLNSQNLKLQDLHKSLASGQGGSLQILSGGNLDIMANLTTTGATYRKLSENLNGQFIAIMDKSEIKTGRLKWFANNIFSQLLSLLNIDTSKNTNMNVACAVVRSDIKGGKALFPNGIVFNGSKLKLISSGSINLVNDKIDFTVAPSLNKLADGNITQALASFIKLGGTLEHPKVGLDQASALTTIVGTMATGGAYLGSEVLLNGDDSPCYTALAGTQYASRFPKPSGVKATTKDVYQDVGKQTKDVVKGLEGAAKNLLGAFTGGSKKGK